MKIRKWLMVGSWVVGITTQLHAGTILTSNLPANTAIINIDATKDGAANYGGGSSGQAYWYQPFNTGGTLLEYTIQAGTYSFRVINPSDAAQAFPALTSAQTNQIYTAWSYNTPWVEDFLVFDSAAATNSSLTQLFDGALGPASGYAGGFSSAAQAYNDAITNNYFNLLRTAAAGGRDTTNVITSYTFTNSATLIFAAPDTILGDNQGGVSVLISPIITGVPVLTIAPSGAGQATISWTPATPGFVLQESSSLLPAGWSYSASGATNPVTVPPSSAQKFFRLSNP